jgi:hypothetical protein
MVCSVSSLEILLCVEILNILQNKWEQHNSWNSLESNPTTLLCGSFHAISCNRWWLIMSISDRQHSVSGKHKKIEPNFIYSSLTRGTMNIVRLMLCVLFNYNMSDKIRKMSINVEFEYMWQKGLSCLTYGRIVYLFIMCQSLHDYDYHLLEIRCAIF